jgi:hypothetical protein
MAQTRTWSMSGGLTAIDPRQSTRSVGMTEKTVINIDDVPLVDRGNGKQFAVKWGRVGLWSGSITWVAWCHPPLHRGRGLASIGDNSVGDRDRITNSRRTGSAPTFDDDAPITVEIAPCQSWTGHSKRGQHQSTGGDPDIVSAQARSRAAGDREFPHVVCW